MLILRAKVHQEEHMRVRKTLHEAIEECLALAIDPMEILEDQEEGLLSRFPQQQPLHRVVRELATVAGLETVPSGIVVRHVEQSQQRRRCRLQCAVEGEQFARHLLTDLSEAVPALDLEVALEEVDHR